MSRLSAHDVEYWLSVRHKDGNALVPTLWASLLGTDDL
jgi:hypothetical protein